MEINARYLFWQVIRVVNGASAKAAKADVGGLKLIAKSPGEWMNGDETKGIRARIDHKTKDPNDDTLFNLTIENNQRKKILKKLPRLLK